MASGAVTVLAAARWPVGDRSCRRLACQQRPPGRWLAGLVAAAQALRDFAVRRGCRREPDQPMLMQDLKFEPARIARQLDGGRQSPRAAWWSHGQWCRSRCRRSGGQWQRLRRAVASQAALPTGGHLRGRRSSGYVEFDGAEPASDGREPPRLTATASDTCCRSASSFLPASSWFARPMNIPSDDQARRHAMASRMTLGAQRLRQLICYEDLFWRGDGRQRGRGPARRRSSSTASNLAWFRHLDDPGPAPASSRACRPWSSSGPSSAPPTPARRW